LEQINDKEMNDKNLNEQDENDYTDNKTTSTLSSFSSANKKNRQRSLRFKFDDNRLVKSLFF
jgi:hypothetical protein